MLATFSANDSAKSLHSTKQNDLGKTASIMGYDPKSNISPLQNRLLAQSLNKPSEIQLSSFKQQAIDLNRSFDTSIDIDKLEMYRNSSNKISLARLPDSKHERINTDIDLDKTLSPSQRNGLVVSDQPSSLPRIPNIFGSKRSFNETAPQINSDTNIMRRTMRMNG